MPSDNHQPSCVVLLSRHHFDSFYSPAMQAELRELFANLNQVDPDKFSPAECVEKLRQHNPDVVLVGWGSPALPDDYPVGEDGLKYVCNTCGGIRNLVPKSLIDRGLTVTDWGTAISHTVAEGALLLMLASHRRLMPQLVDIRENGGWDQIAPLSLFRRTIGFHGFGRVAQALAMLLRPFDVSISACAEGVPMSILEEFGVHHQPCLESLFSDNDIVVELEALTPWTEGKVTKEELSAIPEGGSFVNVARAGIVVEEDLIQIAKEGKIQIGLDVFHKEPLPEDSPLRRLPNVIVTPHVAGPTPDTLRLCGDHAIKNLRRWVCGDSLDSVIDVHRFDLMT